MKGDKSKLFVKVLAIAMIVVLGAFAFTACDLFGGNSDSNSNNGTNSSNNSNSNNSSSSSTNKPTSVEISVYTDGVPQKYTAVYGELVELGTLVKSGYMIKNVTDKNGVEYFNYKGLSNSMWQESFPTEFYANFVPVSNLSYTYTTQWTEPEKINISASGTTFTYIFGENLTQIHSAILGNFQERVKLSFTFRSRGTGGNLQYRVIANTDEVVFEKMMGSTSTYETVTFEVEVTAYMVRKQFQIQFVTKNITLFDNWYVKDMVATISIGY